jgi:hypothetical protein
MINTEKKAIITLEKHINNLTNQNTCVLLRLINSLSLATLVVR